MDKESQKKKKRNCAREPKKESKSRTLAHLFYGALIKLFQLKSRSQFPQWAIDCTMGAYFTTRLVLWQWPLGARMGRGCVLFSGRVCLYVPGNWTPNQGTATVIYTYWSVEWCCDWWCVRASTATNPLKAHPLQMLCGCGLGAEQCRWQWLQVFQVPV